jgi:hypothetical protein
VSHSGTDGGLFCLNDLIDTTNDNSDNCNGLNRNYYNYHNDIAGVNNSRMLDYGILTYEKIQNS